MPRYIDQPPPERRMSPPYTLRVPVPAADIDRHGHLNNVAHVRLVQDAAVAHWRAVAPADLRDAVSWVVRRHEIDYRLPVRPDDEIELVTWVGEPTAATWERFVEVRRAADGAVLTAARTVWVLIDAVTHRPRRIDAALRKLFTA
jgi:acyl-CoA thioester hydrolase